MLSQVNRCLKDLMLTFSFHGTCMSYHCLSSKEACLKLLRTHYMFNMFSIQDVCGIIYLLMEIHECICKWIVMGELKVI